MAKYKVVKPVVSGGKAQKVGATVEGTAEQMSHLLAKGYVEKVKALPKPKGRSKS